MALYGVLYPGHTDTSPTDSAVSVRVFSQILLMIILGIIKTL
jgi:hypothetical protein